MKRKFALSLVMATILLVATVLVGCVGGGNDEPAPTAAPIQLLADKVSALESRMSGAENAIGSLGSVTALRQEVDALKAAINGLNIPVDQSATITALNNSLDALAVKVAALEAAELPEAPIDQVTAYVELGSVIKITVHAPSVMEVAFELTFHIEKPYAAGEPNDTLEDAIKSLYAASPVKLLAGSTPLMPYFKLAWDGVDQWMFFGVSFLTPSTSVGIGETVKEIMVMGFGLDPSVDFVTVRVMAVAESGTITQW